MDFNDLTDEQKAKAQACKTPDELLALAKEEGYTLSDDELDGVSGGVNWGRCEDCNCDVCQTNCTRCTGNAR